MDESPSSQQTLPEIIAAALKRDERLDQIRQSREGQAQARKLQNALKKQYKL